MRLAVCALSAVLLSGCSWIGGGFGGGQGQGFNGPSAQYNAAAGRYNGGVNAGRVDPCAIYSPQQPVPYGCDPADVTLATSGGFPQKPDFSNGYAQATGGYGSHVDVAHKQSAFYEPKGERRKPRWRGSFGLGFEKTVTGTLFDVAQDGALIPSTNYNPQEFNEGFVTGSEASGTVTTTIFTANDQFSNFPAGETVADGVLVDNRFESISNPDLAFGDVHSTPLYLKAGGEFILSPKATLFGNVGYAYAEGETLTGATVDGTLYRRVETQDFIPDAVNPGAFIANGAPNIGVSFIPNQQIATFEYDFSNSQRIDLEAGARYYFDPIVRDQGHKTLTPFVSASGGASYYNGVDVNVTQEQTFYQSTFEANNGTIDTYDVTSGTASVELYDSQWVPSGQINAGMEWQVTPKTALAFEAGLRFEGERELTNGNKGDTRISIPFGIRGSYNF